MIALTVLHDLGLILDPCLPNGVVMEHLALAVHPDVVAGIAARVFPVRRLPVLLVLGHEVAHTHHAADRDPHLDDRPKAEKPRIVLKADHHHPPPETDVLHRVVVHTILEAGPQHP